MLRSCSTAVPACPAMAPKRRFGTPGPPPAATIARNTPSPSSMRPATACRAIRRLRRRGTAPPPPADLSPVPPVPVTPVDAVLPAGQNPSKVALVWNTPEQPVPVEYYVELRALDASGSREVSASYVEASATLVELPGVPQRYAWRVYAVARQGAHYASSAWKSFSIGKAGAD